MTQAKASITALSSVSFGWLHHEGGFTFEEAFFLDPKVRLEREAAMQAFVARRFPDIPVYNMEAHLVQVEGRRRPVALVGGIQPNLILAAALGSPFAFAPDKDPDIAAPPLAELDSVDELWNIDWAGRWPISLFLDQIGRMREAVGATHTIVPPFFWDTTGRATTHGILTTAQKLIGERIFLDMADRPVFVEEFLAWIVDAYTKQIHLLADAAGMTITGLHTGDCSACMMGPDQYEQFILPHLNHLARAIGPLRLHSCGKSDHLLDVFAKVEGLKSLNVGSATSLIGVRQRFGDIRVDLIPETKQLTAGTPADVDTWVRQVIEENGTGTLEIQCHLDLGQPEANCVQIHRTLDELGYPCPRVEVY